jgi:2-oxoglutarate ferredoxin oxidoreductase subunit alpha
VQHALNWMEEYQLPVFFLIDQDLAIANCPLDGLDLKRVPIKRGKLLTAAQAEATKEDEYKRFEFTEDGVSPRATPGMKNVLYLSSGSEHDDRGVITENKANRNRMMEKRMLKLDSFQKAISYPAVDIIGPADAKVGVLTWGSTTSAVDEAVATMHEPKIKRMSVKVLWPFPAKEVKAFLDSVDTLIAVENNYSGQLATLVQTVVGGHEKIRRVVKYDGTPFRPSEIVKGIEEEL